MTIRVNISFEDDVLTIVDQEAKQLGLSRSSYLSYLAMKERGMRGFGYAFEKFFQGIDFLMGEGDICRRMGYAYNVISRPWDDTNMPKDALLLLGDLREMVSSHYPDKPDNSDDGNFNNGAYQAGKNMTEQQRDEFCRLFLKIYSILARADHSSFWIRH